MAKHTEGTLEAVGDVVFVGRNCIIMCDTDNATMARYAANARRVALTWNCHDELVAALTKARGLVAKEVEDRGDNDSIYWKSAKQTLAEIDAALSKASA